MTNKTFEASIQFDDKKPGLNEILIDLICSLGISFDEITELTQWGKSYLLVFFDTRKKANALQKQIVALNLKGISIQIKSLKEEEWLTKWKREFRPFMLTDCVKIVPAWLKDKHKTNRLPVYIDTGIAFGTGLHATTRFMACFVEKCRGQYQTFLDIGTGTGILAIIAAKMGAEHVEAIDISHDAIIIARDNFAVNECHFKKLQAIDFDKFKPDIKYDYVAANLITHDLVRFKQKIIGLVKKGGHLAVSGVSVNNYDFFRKEFTSKRIKCLKIEKSEGWAALLFKKVS